MQISTDFTENVNNFRKILTFICKDVTVDFGIQITGFKFCEKNLT